MYIAKYTLHLRPGINGRFIKYLLPCSNALTQSREYLIGESWGRAFDPLGRKLCREREKRRVLIQMNTVSFGPGYIQALYYLVRAATL